MRWWLRARHRLPRLLSVSGGASSKANCRKAQRRWAKIGCAILQLDGDGDVSTCSEPAAQPSSPVSSPSAPLPPSPGDQASGKKKCCDCSVKDIFEFDFKKCRDCIKKLICRKCFPSAQEYYLKYSFKYILKYCQVECCH